MCQRDKKNKHMIFREEYVKDTQDDQQRRHCNNDIANSTTVLLNKHEVKDQNKT